MKNLILPVLLLSLTSLAGCSSKVEYVFPETTNPFATDESNKEHGFTNDKKLRLTHHTHFKFDSVLVSDSSITNIKAHADFIMEHPNTRVLVEGHADDSGTEAYNRELGMRRAKRIANILMTYGVTEEQIILRSYSNGKPLSSTSDSLNRRATIIY